MARGDEWGRTISPHGKGKKQMTHIGPMTEAVMTPGTIRIVRGPAGYAQGTWGYVVTRGVDQWIGGGHPFAATARAAARHLVRHLDAKAGRE